MRPSFNAMVTGIFASVCGFLIVIVVPALGASEVRHFERVSPSFKGGFGATEVEAVSEESDSVAYFSPGIFAGAPTGLSGLDTLSYIARRDEGGWTSKSLLPPSLVLPFVLSSRDITVGLDTTLAVGNPGSSFEQAGQEGRQTEFAIHDTSLVDSADNWEAGGLVETLDQTTPSITYEGANSDFCHLFFHSEGEKGALIPEALGTVRQLYEFIRGCHGESSGVRLVSLDEKGDPLSGQCAVDLGVEDYNHLAPTTFNAVASRGDQVFFTSCIDNSSSHHQLFVRLAGEKTIEVSKPLEDGCGEDEIPCNGALTRANSNFAGASEDGSHVYFTTDAQLTEEDADNSADLYLATIGCTASVSCSPAERRVTGLVDASHDPNVGEAADVLGVVRRAPDGSHIYFVATGNLLTEGDRMTLENQHKEVPKPGADNLYVYDSLSKGVSFVGDICSAFEMSGTVEDAHCPSKLGVDTQLLTDNSEVHTAGRDGRFLVFVSYGQLTPDDTDFNKDIYRYDSVTGELNRVSVGEAGADANGNDSAFEANLSVSNLGRSVLLQHELNSRAMSDDGTRGVFVSAEPLSPRAVNGLPNVYEWRDVGGKPEVSLLSGGSGGTPTEDVVMAPSGNDVFFVTTEGLVGQDRDGEPDIYDARFGPGFPEPLVPQTPCEGDACQGPLTNPAPLLIPASVSQTPGENFAPPRGPSRKKKTKVRVRAGKKHQKKIHSGVRRRNVRRASHKAGRSNKVTAGRGQ